MANEELTKVQDELVVLHVNEAEDPRMSAKIELPDYGSVSEQKVLKSVKDVFKGFDYTAGMSMGFSGTDDLAQYTINTMEDIKNVSQTARVNQIYHKAAVLARFWYLSDAINTALNKGEYGTNAVNKLANAMHLSVPYIYHMRSVATRLSVVDCFLLGTRDLDTSHLRKLAQVKDDSVRKAIIKAFLDCYKDTSNPEVAAEAKKQFVAAVNSNLNTTAIELGTSDPLNGGSDIEVSPEYTEMDKQLGSWISLAKKFCNEKSLDAFVNASESFFITEETPDAEERLDEIKEKAQELTNLLVAVQGSIATLTTELDSLQGVDVTEK